MEEKKTEFIAWIRTHRKQLLFAGISVTAIIGVIFGLKNKETIMELWDSLEKSIMRVSKKMSESSNVAQVESPILEEGIQKRLYTSPQRAFAVKSHIRNLSGGRHHSAEKVAEAATLGIFLLPNQTLVDGYTKYAV